MNVLFILVEKKDFDHFVHFLLCDFLLPPRTLGIINQQMTPLVTLVAYQKTHHIEINLVNADGHFDHPANSRM